MLAVAVVAGAGWWVLHTPWFSAKEVTVIGVKGRLAAAVLRASGLRAHPALVSIDPAAVAARVEALPEIGHVVVRRHFPDAVSVAVTLRRPVATVARVGGGVALVDRRGRVLADEASPQPGLVALSVLGPPPGPPGTFLPARDRGGLEVAATLPPALRPLTTVVAVGSAGSVRLGLAAGVDVALGPPVNLAAKYEAAASVLAAATVAPGDVLDVSVPAAPVLSAGPG